MWLVVLCQSLFILFINLTPLIPLSLKRRGGRGFREGLRPSLTYTPPSLIKGRGQGDRLLKNFKEILIYTSWMAYTIFRGT